LVCVMTVQELLHALGSQVENVNLIEIHHYLHRSKVSVCG